MNLPSNLKYTEDHKWIKIQGNIATVGITDFAQGELGDIVYVDVNTLEDTVEEGELFGSVEAVKTISDLFMPLTGEVVEFNEALKDDPELVNSNPYGEGWMIKIEISDSSQIKNLLDAETYKKFIEG